MTNTNITSFRKNLFGYMDQVLEYNDIINVTTKKGNAVVLSEADYNGLMETLYLSSDPRVRAEILQGMRTPIEDCVPEEEVEW